MTKFINPVSSECCIIKDVLDGYKWMDAPNMSKCVDMYMYLYDIQKTVEDGILVKYNKKYDGLHGEYKEYYSNGRLRVSTQYVDGKRHGEFKGYYENGILVVSMMYHYGVLHGPKKIYYYWNGELSEEVNYENGIKHGIYKIYRDDGTLLSEVH